MGIALGELARRIEGELQGDPACMITSVATLQNAGPGTIAFLAGARHRKYLADTRASAVILTPAHKDESPTATVIVSNPYAAYARAVSILHPVSSPRPGVHPAAVIGAACRIDETAWIGPACVLEERVTIGPGVSLGGGCFIGRDSFIGAGSILHARVVVCHGVRIGARALVHPAAVIGSDGFGLAEDDGKWLKVPQLGGVAIGDDVEIGAGTTIDRGALEDTVIENGVKLDNQIQIAHNAHIGAHTAIAGCVGISGSVRIGRHCRIGGGAGIFGHLQIADNVTITGMTMVTKSITKPGVYSSGVAAQANALWNRNCARIRQLDTLARKVQALERRLAGKG
jgi:UDP-3-O-[3-hydroxymyristoyl] glucosamine N-acyltransferase